MLSARELSDQIEIGQLVQRYGAAIDARDYALLDTVFTPDARTNYELGTLGNRTTWPQMRELFEKFNAVLGGAVGETLAAPRWPPLPLRAMKRRAHESAPSSLTEV